MLGHRHSVDIDLFNVNSFDTKAIEAELQAHFPNYEGLYSSSYGLSCQINAIKTDIYCWNEPLLNPVTEIDGLRLISDDDIFAMKLEAILTRREKKDYIDIAELLKTQTLDWGINYHQRKYKKKDTSLMMNALSCIDEAEDSFMPMMCNEMTWPKAHEVIYQAVQEFVWLEKQRVKNKHRQ